ncbi:hypothetical protein C7S18_00735 [Ahniella affigens]|uniref:Phosphatidylinositol diacylglycerol-lyase n=1 Tax=Ahniella affigens TaxID=2021234 RepID=A0A2P1PLV6_9GAMM|nr:hypothetical protein [Ahniella affigens]AVP95813.1 hypothetical protein C7S18_00735 [Ahniella affigens]
MRSVFFGLGLEYDKGSDPSVGLNSAGTVLDVHKNEAGVTLYYRLGKLNKASVDWEASSHYLDGGTQPDCALNDNDYAVEVHRNEAGFTLYTRLGQYDRLTHSMTWYESKDSGGGYEPGVALNNSNVAVEVHRTNNVLHTNRLYIRVGNIEGEIVDWEDDEQYDTGGFPRVALNNHGRVVEVHQAGSLENEPTALWLKLGRVDGDKVEFEGDPINFATGNKPCVTVTDTDDVIVLWTNGGALSQRVGRIVGTTIEWTDDGVPFDDGIAPSIASAAGMTLQVHQSETILYGLHYSSSILTDRAIWMQERLNALGNRQLGALVLPASHDSSMYRGGPIESLARTQNLSIFDQLEYGIRYFDLRVRWTGSKFVMFHGPVDGPDLADILDGIKRYANFGHQEVAILKFSHFKDIDNARYAEFTTQVDNAIGDWLVKTKVAGKRLAQMTLNEYVSQGTALLAVVDENYAIDVPKAGFWVYRDAEWEGDAHGSGYDPIVGDLRVFDVYSDALLVDNMVEDQRAKFAAYNGTCAKNPDVPCDMYLMSWTLTPPTDVWDVSKAANRILGEQMTEIPVPNDSGEIINMIYVDYVEFARVTDVVLFQNGVPFPVG